MKTTTKKKTTTTKKKSITVKSQSLDLPKYPFVFEVFDLVSRQRSKAKKIEVLKRYEDISVKSVLIWNFDESVISVLPPGEVPYSGYDEQNTYSGTLSTKINEEVRNIHNTGSFSLGSSDKQGHTTVRREWKHFYHFVKGGNDKLPATRREMMFINLLRGLHPKEAQVLVLVKDKDLQTKYKITVENVKQAYPNMTWSV